MIVKNLLIIACSLLLIFIIIVLCLMLYAIITFTIAEFLHKKRIDDNIKDIENTLKKWGVF